MDVDTGSFEYDADSESSQRSAMTHALGAAPHQSSYMQEEISACEITDKSAEVEESAATSEYLSGTQVRTYNQADISDKSTLAGIISRDSEYFTAFSELSSQAEDMQDETANSGEIESRRHRHSAVFDFSDVHLGPDMGPVSSGTSGSTVTDFLEGCLDILDNDNGTSQTSSHSQTWALIHNQVPTVDNESRDQNTGVIEEILLSHEVIPALLPTCSQVECDFIANLLIPSASEYTRRATHEHPAWSQPVGLPYVKPLHALDIDVLSDLRQREPELIPTRPATPMGSARNKEEGGGNPMTIDLSAHKVAATLTLQPSDSSLYSLFGTSPPSSQMQSAQ